ncbi:MAG TPA: hypothetical protein VME20_05535 [Acidimicrobiales bacterium]|nr:hypothetical protein [Acidimicrobiales bacterium]
MVLRNFFTAAGAVIALAAAGAGVVAGAALPEKATGYDNFHTSQGFVKVNPDVLLVTSTSGKAIHRWAPGPQNDQALDAGSYVELACPGAPPLKGFPNATAALPFPGAQLTLSHGKYGFSASWTTKVQKDRWSSTAAAPTLHVTLSGTVTSSTRIDGTLAVSGGGCTTSTPLAYSAHADKAYNVTPGT